MAVATRSAPRSAPRTRFACSECGGASPKWEGRCSGCGAWNSLVEEVATSAAARSRAPARPAGVVRLDRLAIHAAARTPTGSVEFDRVLGGGLVPGSLVLL